MREPASEAAADDREAKTELAKTELAKTQGGGPRRGEPRSAWADLALIPNQLTLSRFAAAAAIPIVFLSLERPAAEIVALSLFVYASLTDFLDGYLARRLNQMSAIGATLDSLADKALLLATLAALCWVVYPTFWAFHVGAGLIALREIGISVLRKVMGKIQALSVRRDAKWKTATQMTSVSLLLAVGLAAQALGEVASLWLERLGFALFAVAVVLTLTSGLAYLRGALAAKRAVVAKARSA